MRTGSGALVVALAGVALVGCGGGGAGSVGVGRCATPYVGEVRSGAMTSVVLLRPDFTVARRLADDATKPAISPDGRTVAFLQRVVLPPPVGASASTSKMALTTIRVDGSGRRTPVDEGISHDDPSWAPEGNVILFRRLDGEGDQGGEGNEGNGRYMTVPANGGQPQVLLHPDPDNAAYTAARFSPDGVEVVLVRRLGRFRDVVVADVSTREVVRGVAEGTSAVWSPDSKRFALGGRGREVDGGIPRVELRGRRATSGRDVTDSASAATEVLLWGKAGVAYERTVAGGTEPELWLADPETLVSTLVPRVSATSTAAIVRPTSVIPGC